MTQKTKAGFVATTMVCFVAWMLGGYVGQEIAHRSPLSVGASVGFLMALIVAPPVGFLAYVFRQPLRRLLRLRPLPLPREAEG